MPGSGRPAALVTEKDGRNRGKRPDPVTIMEDEGEYRVPENEEYGRYGGYDDGWTQVIKERPKEKEAAGQKATKGKKGKRSL